MSPADALVNPTKVLQVLYAANRSKSIEEFPRTVAEHFQEVFSSEHEFRQIPTLDLNNPPASFANGSLVLFRAMVQDTSLSPELYLATHKKGGCGGWGITNDLTFEEDVQYDNLRECTAIWAVSIPGLSTWCYEETFSNTSTHDVLLPHKYPIPDVPYVGVQLKIYDEKISNPLRTTDLASFIGILTSEPFRAELEVSGPLHVPTLHVLFTVPIPASIVSRTFPEPLILPTAQSIRNELINWIAEEGLAGDLIAAEWVLICTISRVRSRHPPILPLSLTISNFPTDTEHPNSPPTIFNVLSLIFSLVSVLSLSLDTLNRGSYSPESKDEDLHSGRLQLPKSSILVINEGAITEGAVNATGVANIRAIQEMMKSQTLDYVFPYSGFQFETDVTFITTTDSKKSAFFQTDVNIPFRPRIIDNLTANLYKVKDAISLPPTEKLRKFRELVGGAKTGSVLVGEVMGKFVEEEFIRERLQITNQRSDGTAGGFSPDDLIRRMLVTRLHALSLHQYEVEQINWESAKELERVLRSCR
ncbi:hypothetical protein BDN70DRAFT_878513 [Pholiota conissans]|uniref:Mini-chromosome maintenance complex-binding protein n=1 Tax=Pholiota conissans TaxID=109636 RepID=A0A9P5Z458_9AGAR|nr:hypothetical protein BDN70DRAFT_878513 [Pholiota conissans]